MTISRILSLKGLGLGTLILLLSSTISFVSQANAAQIEWVWSGAVTAKSAVIKAKSDSRTEQVQLTLSTLADSAVTGSVHRSGTPDANGIVAFKVADLIPDTIYRYSVGAGDADGLTGQFRTFAEKAFSFRVVFGSCAKTGSNHEVWSTMKEMNPLFFLHMGDFHYEDIKPNKPERFRKAFDKCLRSLRQSALYRHAPIAYVWDDHDFGPNDSDGTSLSKPAALKTYQQYVPHYPLNRSGGRVETIQQAFTAGRVRFILTDVRAERSPENDPDGPAKSMLGEKQRAWLLQELDDAASNYPLVVWVNVVPWITKNAPGSGHGWEPYSHERTLIADRIKALGLVDRLLILSGDGHMVAIDDGTNSNYASNQEPGEGAFPVMHAAPIHRYPRVKGGPYSHGTYARKRLFGLIQETQFGLMQVKDDGQTLVVELSGRDSEGSLLPNMQLQLLCDNSGCRTR